MHSFVQPIARSRLAAAARRAAAARPARGLSSSSSSSSAPAPRSTQLSRFPAKQGLYDPALEKDSCGVGLVAHLKGVPSRAIVKDAGLALVNMEHRGGCGCDPQSGDGAGIQTALPHDFFARVARDEASIKLPAPGAYAAGNIFLPVDADAAQKAKDLLVHAVKAQGLEVLGWRKPPTDNSTLGAMSVETEPLIEQLFVAKPAALSSTDFERELYMARRVAENGAKALGPALDDFYVCTLSGRTITYKGQLTTAQVFEYYSDLRQDDYMSHMALVHSRFSTNTFPSWPRAQPNRARAARRRASHAGGRAAARSRARRRAPFLARSRAHRLRRLRARRARRALRAPFAVAATARLCPAPDGHRCRHALPQRRDQHAQGQQEHAHVPRGRCPLDLLWRADRAALPTCIGRPLGFGQL